MKAFAVLLLCVTTLSGALFVLICPTIDTSGRVGSGVSVGTNGVSVWDPYQLQEAGKLLPASEWTNSSLTVTTNGSERQVSAPLDSARKFYRIHHQ